MSMISVAVHKFGAGFISVYGDVNFEVGTVKLVNAFCRSSPATNLVDLSASMKLEDRAYDAMLACKADGNRAFTSGEFTMAIECYERSLGHFDGGGTQGSSAQRAEKVKVLSNTAECHLRLGAARAAADAASLALKIDNSHEKSRFRRAKALSQLAEQEQREGKGREKSLLLEAKVDVDFLLAQPTCSPSLPALCRNT